MKKGLSTFFPWACCPSNRLLGNGVNGKSLAKIIKTSPVGAAHFLLCLIIAVFHACPKTRSQRKQISFSAMVFKKLNNYFECCRFCRICKYRVVTLHSQN